MTRCIDAYSHVGLPRFCTVAQALAVCDQWGIEKAVLVLGPGVPDAADLAEAVVKNAGRIRAVGIPFGQTGGQRAEFAQAQLDAGFAGLRLEPSHVLGDEAVLEMLGERGRWIYAINPLASADVAGRLVEWLERHQGCRIAAPHLLRASPLPLDREDHRMHRELLQHPRFYAILSRHGGLDSRMPYPHADFVPWVRQLIAYCGWERMMWGSEHPVLLWRDERMDRCRDWLAELKLHRDEREMARYLWGNAAGAMFGDPPPEVNRPLSVPGWVNEQFNRDRTVPLMSHSAIDLPMEAWPQLVSAYLEAARQEPELTVGGFLARKLNRERVEASATEGSK